MDYERAIETQRLRLLRLVAGLLAVVVFFSARPFFYAVPQWLSEGVCSILSRAEAAAQCLVIAQARLIAARTGSAVDPRRYLDHRDRENIESANCGSLNELRERLLRLLALLEDLPRFGLRLLRRIEKRVRRMGSAKRTHQIAPCRDTSDALFSLRLLEVRIERPPDKGIGISWFRKPPSRYREGGVDGWA